MIKIYNNNKKLLKKLLFLAFPIILQDLVNSAVNLLDFLMIGKLGLNSINGVGLSNQIFFLFILVVFGTTSGSSVLMGQFWGKKDVSSIHKVMGMCFVVSMSAAVIFASAAIFAPGLLLSVYTGNEDVIAKGSSYLRIVGISYLFSAVTVTFNAALRSIGQTKIPMFTSVIALVCNFILNYFFIFIVKWGVAGAALATLIARVLELAVQIIIIRRLKLPVACRVKNYFTADRALIRQFAKIASPVILNEFVWALGTTLYTVAYQFCGNEAQGAMQIASQVQQIFMVFGMGLGSGCGIILANTLGAGERDLAISYSRKCLLMAVAASAVMGAALFIASPFIISFYDVPDIVVEYALSLLRIISFGVVIKTYNFTTVVAILRSGGDTKYALFADVGAVWLVGVPMAFLGAYFLHLPIYYVLPMVYCEELFKMITTSVRVFSNKWANCVV